MSAYKSRFFKLIITLFYIYKHSLIVGVRTHKRLRQTKRTIFLYIFFVKSSAYSPDRVTKIFVKCQEKKNTLEQLTQTLSKMLSHYQCNSKLKCIFHREQHLEFVLKNPPVAVDVQPTIPTLILRVTTLHSTYVVFARVQNACCTRFFTHICQMNAALCAFVRLRCVCIQIEMKNLNACAIIIHLSSVFIIFFGLPNFLYYHYSSRPLV